MLPKTHRLARPDFLKVKNLGTTFSSPHYSLLSLLSPLGHNRYAIVVSTKLHKHAVVRNRLRRAIYQAVTNLPGSHDNILFPKKSILNLSSADINTELVKSLSTALS